MSVEKVTRVGGEVVWRVRWRQHGRNRARTFSTRRDARDFDAEVRRQRRPEASQRLTPAPRRSANTDRNGAASHAATLAAKTRLHYASLYDYHLRPYLGSIALREITPGRDRRWQADRLASGAGPLAVPCDGSVGSILEHAFVGGHVSANPARRVKKARSPRREEVQPLSPGTIEAMREALDARDATLISVLAYAGLRPGEAGSEVGRRPRADPAHPAGDLARRGVGHQDAAAPDRPAIGAARCGSAVLANGCWSTRRLRARVPWKGGSAVDAGRLSVVASAGVQAGDGGCRPGARPPVRLRHSFASLLLHEGRSVIYVARQLGHDARLTLTRYGHVIDELEDSPRIDAEAVIADARLAVRTAGSEDMHDLRS